MGETAEMSEDQQRRRPGRPRDVGADDAIMDAVVEILTEVGFRGLTIDAVAQRAGVGKATIYRRWDGKEQLVLDALAAGRLPVPQPDTGTLHDDLLAYYLPLADLEAQQGAVRLMPALAAEAAVDADLADRLHAFVSDRRAPVAGILRRAQERGEVNDDVDIELVVDLLTGAIMYRLYFSGAVVDEGRDPPVAPWRAHRHRRDRRLRRALGHARNRTAATAATNAVSTGIASLVYGCALPPSTTVPMIRTRSTLVARNSTPVSAWTARSSTSRQARNPASAHETAP